MITVIIAWIDFAEDKDGNVFAQKLNADGDMLWDNNEFQYVKQQGVQISLNIVPDEAGGAIIVWNDERHQKLLLHRECQVKVKQAGRQTA